MQKIQKMDIYIYIYLIKGLLCSKDAKFTQFSNASTLNSSELSYIDFVQMLCFVSYICTYFYVDES